MAGAFAGRVVVVTGASSGIGRELARALAAAGAKLGLLARRGELLETLAGEVRSAGGVAEWATANVAEREPTLAAVHSLRDRLGPVDLMVANSGVGVPTKLFEGINADEVQRMIRVNLFGVMNAFEAVLPEMVRRRSGHVAGVSSLASYKGLPGQSAYCATKAAISTYLEGLRIQMRPLGVTVTTICPGFIRTPMTAEHRFRMPFLMDADQAARKIVRALYWKRKVFDFPWPMALMMRLTWLAPDWLMSLATGKYVHRVPGTPIPT